MTASARHREPASLAGDRSEAVLHKMQQIVYERTMYAPIWQLAFINGHGPRVGESGFGLIPGFDYTGPTKTSRSKPNPRHRTMPRGSEEKS